MKRRFLVVLAMAVGAVPTLAVTAPASAATAPDPVTSIGYLLGCIQNGLSNPSSITACVQAIVDELRGLVDDVIAGLPTGGPPAAAAAVAPTTLPGVGGLTGGANPLGTVSLSPTGLPTITAPGTTASLPGLSGIKLSAPTLLDSAPVSLLPNFSTISQTSSKPAPASIPVSLGDATALVGIAALALLGGRRKLRQRAAA